MTLLLLEYLGSVALVLAVSVLGFRATGTTSPVIDVTPLLPQAIAIPTAHRLREQERQAQREERRALDGWRT